MRAGRSKLPVVLTIQSAWLRLVAQSMPLKLPWESVGQFGGLMVQETSIGIWSRTRHMQTGIWELMYRRTNNSFKPNPLRESGYFNQPLRWNIQNGTTTDNAINKSAKG